MDLKVLGINHRTAPLELRERLSLPGELSVRLLRSLRAEGTLGEAMVLDTCNRTEVYCVPLRQTRPELLQQLVLREISNLKGVPVEADPKHFYCHEGLEAVQHLFSLTAALDSLIVGEHQILGQVKNAYRLALDEQTAGFLLNKSLHWAFRVGKRVQTETELGRGAASVAAASVELMSQLFASLSGKCVLLIGAGQTAQAAARALVGRGVSRLLVANRTLETAQRMLEQLLEDLRGKPSEDDPSSGAEQVKCPALCKKEAQTEPSPQVLPSTIQAQAMTLEDLPSFISQADLIIASTSATEPVLTRQAVGHVLASGGRTVFIMDIGVPRDVDPELGKLRNVILYNIDDLNSLVQCHIEQRKLEIPKAQAIVQDELQQFRRWLNSRQLAPTIQLLQQHFKALRQAEIQRYGGQINGQSEIIDAVTQSLCSKLLHQPMKFLNSLPENASPAQTLADVDLIRRFFGLDDSVKKESGGS